MAISVFAFVPKLYFNISRKLLTCVSYSCIRLGCLNGDKNATFQHQREVYTVCKNIIVIKDAPGYFAAIIRIAGKMMVTIYDQS